MTGQLTFSQNVTKSQWSSGRLLPHWKGAPHMARSSPDTSPEDLAIADAVATRAAGRRPRAIFSLGKEKTLPYYGITATATPPGSPVSTRAGTGQRKGGMLRRDAQPPALRPAATLAEEAGRGIVAKAFMQVFGPRGGRRVAYDAELASTLLMSGQLS